MSRIDESVVARAKRAAEVIAPQAREIERERRLPSPAVDALVSAGAFKLLVPREYGGAETSVATLVAFVETIARADGSAGWCTMVGASSGLMSAFLDEPTARAVYTPDDVITAGVFAPMGVATRVEGGYRVRGRWPFGSASQHAGWCMGGAMIESAEPGGRPEMRSMLFSASELRIHDTWDTSGLRGTGSHDFEVEDVLVPEERTFSLMGAPRRSEPIYRQPFFGTLAAGVAAVSLGVARAAIDALVELASVKTQGGTKKTIGQRELVQLHVARADAMVRASRALVLESVEAAADEVERDGRPSLRARASIRLAACHAATECASAVDLVYEAGGAASIYASSPIQRCWRDAHTATQHVMVSSVARAMAGRVLLGIDSDVAMV